MVTFALLSLREYTVRVHGCLVWIRLLMNLVQDNSHIACLGDPFVGPLTVCPVCDLNIIGLFNTIKRN